MGDEKSAIGMGSSSRDRELLIPVVDSGHDDDVASKPSSSSSSSSHHTGREGLVASMNVHEHLTRQAPNNEGLPTPQNGPSDAQTHNIGVGAGVGAVVAPAPGGHTCNTFTIDPEIVRARLVIINHM